MPINTYPWQSGRAYLRATARLLYDDAALYTLFRVADGHIQAEARPLNSDVWRDSCLEAFVSPEQVTRQHYVNVETNYVGQVLMKFGDSRSDRRSITPEQAADIRIDTSVHSPANTHRRRMTLGGSRQGFPSTHLANSWGSMSHLNRVPSGMEICFAVAVIWFQFTWSSDRPQRRHRISTGQRRSGN